MHVLILLFLAPSQTRTMSSLLKVFLGQHFLSSTSRQWRQALLAFLLSFIAFGAAAQQGCTLPGNTTPGVTTFRLPTDKPVGSVIGPDHTTAAATNTLTLTLRCATGNPSSPAVKTHFAARPGIAMAAGTSDTWTTGVAGLGLRVYQGNTVISTALSGDLTPSNFPIGINTSVSLTFTFELIKTGDVAVGSTSTVQLFDIQLVNASTGSTVATGGTVVYRIPAITSATCELTLGSKSITVSMPTLTQAALPAVNGVSSATGTFNLEFSSCSGPRVYVTLTDLSDATNTTSVLGLTSGGATGMGYQLTYNGTQIVSYGPDSSAAGNVNQLLLEAAPPSSGFVSLPFTVRYYRTQDTVTPGPANAVATFTMSYQ